MQKVSPCRVLTTLIDRVLCQALPRGRTRILRRAVLGWGVKLFVSSQSRPVPLIPQGFSAINEEHIGIFRRKIRSMRDEIVGLLLAKRALVTGISSKENKHRCALRVLG
jgi:hypothetical protein